MIKKPKAQNPMKKKSKVNSIEPQVKLMSEKSFCKIILTSNSINNLIERIIQLLNCLY